MEVDAFPIRLCGVVAASEGTAVFLALAAEKKSAKTFVIYMDAASGTAIRRAVAHEPSERPTTHELIDRFFAGFDIHLNHVVIHHVVNGVFFARMVLTMRNELGEKIVEIDARPSDALVLAAQKERPLFVTQDVLEKVDDMADVLAKLMGPQ